ncbi:hypothetical protein T484DRAFT_1606744, partial [Baffinella frigidus]
SLTHPLTYSLTHSLAHSLTRALTHPLNHSLTHSPTHSPAHSLTRSLTHSTVHSRTSPGAGARSVEARGGRAAGEACGRCGGCAHFQGGVSRPGPTHDGVSLRCPTRDSSP